MHDLITLIQKKIPNINNVYFTFKEYVLEKMNLESTEDCEAILKEFGLDPTTGRIINGHVPVRTIKGETPIRANGKRFVIDGGFSKPYQEKTGIAVTSYRRFTVQAF